MTTVASIIQTVGLLTAVTYAGPADQVEIRLHRRAVPSTSVVRLADVADIEAPDRTSRQRLSATPLMPAPAPGTQRFLQRHEVRDLMVAHGEDLGRLQFVGASTVAVAAQAASSDQRGTVGSDQPATGSNLSEVRRQAWLHGSSRASESTHVLPKDDSEIECRLKELLIDYLKLQSGQDGAWQVSFNVSPRHLRLAHSAQTAPTCSGGSPPWTGRQRLVVTVTTADGAENFPIYADVSLPIDTVVSVRPVGRGDIVTAADLEVQQLELPSSARSRQAAFESIDQLVGMEAKQPLRVGAPVLRGQVRAPLLVKRGETVTVIARGGGIQVRTIAKAKHDASRGELVQLESLETRELYDARVTGIREAVVFAGRSRPPALPADTQHPQTARRTASSVGRN